MSLSNILLEKLIKYFQLDPSVCVWSSLWGQVVLLWERSAILVTMCYYKQMTGSIVVKVDVPTLFPELRKNLVI